MSAKRQPVVTDEEVGQAAKIVHAALWSVGRATSNAEAAFAGRKLLVAERAGRIRPKKAKVPRGN